MKTLPLTSKPHVPSAHAVWPSVMANGRARMFRTLLMFIKENNGNHKCQDAKSNMTF